MERIQTVGPDTFNHEDIDVRMPNESQPPTREIVAMGEIATADAQLEGEVPTDEVTRLDPEEERRKILNANTKQLKNRFGDEFLKGRRQADGQYEGLGARELLSKYLSIPGSVDEIKRLIPNAHNALKTLLDNADYIAGQLALTYDNDDRLKEVEPPRDPYELAKNVGYQLTGPFEAVSEFAGYATDFRSGERICTYNDPGERLRAYHMLWLRSIDADQTVRANELNEKNITERWKQYLRTIGRYDAANDKYNTDKLAPSRQDPYGTSSMSVQVSRSGTHVSIKNRYNHTVTNPDSTFDNNLDAIAYGLKRAVYSRIGREDLLKSSNHSLGEGYIADNDGGIHPYFYERNNRYFGYYEYIENGIVATIDRGQYDMISPELYVSKRADGEVKQTAAGEQKQVELEVTDAAVRRVSLLDQHGDVEYFYDYSYDERQRVADLALTVVKGQGMAVSWNQSLRRLTIADGVRVASIYKNPALGEVVIAEGSKVGYIGSNPALTNLEIPKNAIVGDIKYNSALTTLAIAEDAVVGDIRRNDSLAELLIAKNAKVDTVAGNDLLRNMTIAHGAKVGRTYHNHPNIKIKRQKKWWQR